MEWTKKKSTSRKSIHYNINIPNFHIENLKRFEYFVEMCWKNIVLQKCYL